MCLKIVSLPILNNRSSSNLNVLDITIGSIKNHVAGKLFNPLNAELNPICHLLALLGGATIVVVSRLRVKCDCLCAENLLHLVLS